MTKAIEDNQEEIGFDIMKGQIYENNYYSSKSYS